MEKWWVRLGQSKLKVVKDDSKPGTRNSCVKISEYYSLNFENIEKTITIYRSLSRCVKTEF